MGALFRGATKTPDIPSTKPDRTADTQPEDIVLGTDSDTTKPKGKRSLVKPSGNTTTSGLKV